MKWLRSYASSEGVWKMWESVSPSEGANGENVSVIAFFVYVVEN